MPLMIELHVHPQVASAVSQCSILLTSISAVLSYAVADRIPWSYGYVLMVIALFTVAAGQVVTEWLVRRHKKPRCGFRCGCSRMAGWPAWHGLR